MNNDTQNIKDAVDIVDLVGTYLHLKKAGSNFQARCPFHDEKTPSFMVNPERQIYKCFGCGEAGDIFDFVMKSESLTFPEALKLLASRAGITLTPYFTRQSLSDGGSVRPTGGHFGSGGSEVPVDNKSALYRVNTLATQVFHKVLTGHPVGKVALDYLKNRGLNDETIKTFRLGFAPAKDILGPYLAKNGFKENEVYTAGSPNRFNSRIMFPIYDPLGNTVGFTGRVLDSDQPGPKYLNTRETEIFRKHTILYGWAQAKDAIKKQGYAIVVEGQMDVVASHQAGVKNTVASSGTAITSSHLKRLSRLTENLILAFDADDAGIKTAKTAILMALPLGFTVKVVNYPTGIKDAGEAIEKGAKVWQEIVAGAKYAIEWLVDLEAGIKNQESRINTTVENKRKITKEIVPYLAVISDTIEQAHWVGKLASILSIPEESLRQAIAKHLQAKSSAPKSHIPDSRFKIPDSVPLSLPQQLYGLLTIFPDLRKDHLAIYAKLKPLYDSQKGRITAELAVSYPGLDVEAAKGETTIILTRLRSEKNEKVKNEFASEISSAETAGDRKKVKELLEKLQEKIKSR